MRIRTASIGGAALRLTRIAVVAAVVGAAVCGCGSKDSGDQVAYHAPAAATSTRPTSSASSASAKPSTHVPNTSGPVESDPDLGSNPVLRRQGVGISGVSCQLPAWSADPAAAEAFYRAAIECHNSAWRSTLTGFGIEFTGPKLWAGARSAQYDGGCGHNGTGREAFYCPRDQTIVMPFDTMQPISRNGAGYALAVLSHEYGHHIQQLTGIFNAFQARGNALNWAGSETDLLNRRLELQAWCFSGMFYGTSTGRGSVSKAMADQAYDNNSGAGDRPGERRWHGTSKNVANWFGWGEHPADDPSTPAQPSLYECNPWAARSAAWLE